MTPRLVIVLAVLAANVVGFIAFALVHAGRRSE